MSRLTLSGIAAIAIATLTSPAATDEIPDLGPTLDGELFSLGKEDGYRYGFKLSGWKDVNEHVCVAGASCNSEPFPSHVHAPSKRSEWADTAVEQLTILFKLDRSFDGAVLRLVKAGAETIVVQIDDDDAVRVTKAMMTPQTYEHSDFGAFELPVGNLEAGVHRVRISVADDGEGNGRFGWDAIRLLVPKQ